MENETYDNLMQNEALNEYHPSALNLQNGGIGNAIRLEPGCSQLIDAHQIQILENPQQLQGTTAAPPEILAKTANEPSLIREKSPHHNTTRFLTATLEEDSTAIQHLRGTKMHDTKRIASSLPVSAMQGPLHLISMKCLKRQICLWEKR